MELYCLLDFGGEGSRFTKSIIPIFKSEASYKKNLEFLVGTSVGQVLLRSKGESMSKFSPFYQQTDLHSEVNRQKSKFVLFHIKDLTLLSLLAIFLKMALI